MLEISENWTPEERLRVIARLNKEIGEYALVRTRNCGEEIFSRVEKISFLTNYSSSFLQTNRESILDKLT